MENVILKPWVGEFYAESGYCGKKILVLGDSQYAEDPEDDGLYNDDGTSDSTLWVIQEFIDYLEGKVPHKHWMNTFTRFTNMFIGADKSDKDYKEYAIEFWRSIVFYNFAQRILSRSRLSPTQADYEAGASPFFEVLKEYKPDLVIVWGYRLWRDNMPLEHGKDSVDPVLPGTPDAGNFYDYTIDDKVIRACAIPHPSSATAFNGYEYLQAALASIKV
jgi:hypothetical protein